MFVLMIYDYQTLNVALTPSYLASRLFFATATFIFIFFTKGTRFERYSDECFFLNVFCYGLYFSLFVDYGYTMVFLQVPALATSILTLTSRTFPALMVFACTTGCLAAINSPLYERSINANTLRGDIASAIFVLIVFCSIIFYRAIQLRREKTSKDLLFADIGKKLSIFTHELQGVMRRIDNKAQFLEDEVVELVEIGKLITILTKENVPTIKKNVEIHPIVQKILDENQDHFEYLKIKPVYKTGKLEFIGDEIAFRILFKNLIKNSIEELIENQEQDRVLEIIITENQSISIKNSSRKKRIVAKKLFEPFYSTKKNLTNRGLGLYICQSIAQTFQLQLDLSMESEHQFVATVAS